MKDIEGKIEELLAKSTLVVWNQQDKYPLMSLENQKASILQIEFEKARISSRMVWLEAGDSNNKFFHKYTNHRLNVNHIWAIKSEEGVMIKDQAGISTIAQDYYKSYFSKEGNISVIKQLKVVKEFPHMFSEEEGDDMFLPIKMMELKSVI